MQWLDKISLPIIGILVVTLGLAPYLPQPHVVEKLVMLFAGELKRAIDIFDLLLHGTPWLLLILKLVRLASLRAGRS
jgi:hypothetical protein